MKFRTLSEAKAELGTLVRLAQNGETVVISRHGRPAVRLTPVEEADFQLTGEQARALDEWADRLETNGKVRRYKNAADLMETVRRRRRVKKS
jgi:prevent-host-death family protein